MEIFRDPGKDVGYILSWENWFNPGKIYAGKARLLIICNRMTKYDQLPFVYPKSNLVHPNQPYRNDFLDAMSSVFAWSRLIGVAGTGKRFWKLWGLFIFIFIFAMECGAIYKLVKLLAGLTAYSAGNRSVTARIAGTVFYTSSLVSLILSWRLSSSWHVISGQWISVERMLIVSVPLDKTLKRRMFLVVTIMGICVVGEHLMSMLSSVGLDCPASELLEKYILNSHAFIFAPSDYSIWIAVPVLFFSNVATILYNLQDLIIVLISMGLTSRYYRINEYTSKVSASDKNEKWNNKQTDSHRLFTWRKIREAYVKQAMLVRLIDNYIGGLILLSCSNNFYFICLQLFLGITQNLSGDLIQRLYYFVSLLWMCIRFCSVVLSAAAINVHSRLALKYLHDCTSEGYNVEVDRLQKQLTKDFVALSGMGFFYIDRTILLQVLGALITYELVLIQFDKT